MKLTETERVNKEYYDKNALPWMKVRCGFDDHLRDFKEFQTLLVKGKVIDLGCGTGRDSQLFTSAGYEYTGVDLSKGMIDMAKESLPDSTFQVMNLTELKFEDGCFDGIWSFAAYLHIPKGDIDHAIQETNRVLKPGGIGYIVVKKGSKECYLDSENGQRYWSFYGKRQFARILENNGFNILKSWEDKRDYNPPKDVSVYLCYFIQKT